MFRKNGFLFNKIRPSQSGILYMRWTPIMTPKGIPEKNVFDVISTMY